MSAMGEQIGDICRMIKIEHSIFALPYAWAGSFLAARGMPPIGELILLTIAMVGVRSFAMTFNRIADLENDRGNPRARDRPLVTGKIGLAWAWGFCVCAALVFVASCALLNNICLWLAAPALVFAGGYSLAKRFTPACHYWLGATLGLAPIAGWLAVDPASLGLSALMLSLAVTFWVGAFDIYYAFQDMEYDIRTGTKSIPANFGPNTALALAGFSHILTVIFLALVGIAGALGWPWYVFCAGIAILLIWEHRLIKPDDLTHVNMAFFTLNGIIAPLALAGIILGIYF